MKFSKTHEWIGENTSENVYEIGITEYAQNSMWEIIYIQFFDHIKEGYKINANEAFCIIDSVKTSFEIFSPVSGEIASINTDLKKTIGEKSKDFSKFWLIKVKKNNDDSMSNLMDKSEYDSYIASDTEV